MLDKDAVSHGCTRKFANDVAVFSSMTDSTAATLVMAGGNPVFLALTRLRLGAVDFGVMVFAISSLGERRLFFRGCSLGNSSWASFSDSELDRLDALSSLLSEETMSCWQNGRQIRTLNFFQVHGLMR